MTGRRKHMSCCRINAKSKQRQNPKGCWGWRRGEGTWHNYTWRQFSSSFFCISFINQIEDRKHSLVCCCCCCCWCFWNTEAVGLIYCRSFTHLWHSPDHREPVTHLQNHCHREFMVTSHLSVPVKLIDVFSAIVYHSQGAVRKNRSPGVRHQAEYLTLSNFSVSKGHINSSLKVHCQVEMSGFVSDKTVGTIFSWLCISGN